MEYLSLIALLFLVGPVFGIIAFFQLQSTRRKLGDLEIKAIASSRIARELEQRLALLELGSSGAAPNARQKGQSPDDQRSEEMPPEVKSVAPPQSAVPLDVPPVPALTEDLPPPPPAPPRSNVEETKGEEPAPSPGAVPEPEAQFASRWFIWAGAIVFALAGGFLVKYSVDAGLLGPAQRIGAAIILGLATMGAGEWVRRQPRRIGALVVDDERIPAALTAAGLFITFAAIYGGHGLYQLYLPLTAFVALVVTAVGGAMVAILHGRYGSFVAGLGMLGAYMVPALVSTDNPSAIALFSYLGALNVATLSLLRWRSWTWLGWGVLLGAAIWPLLFLANVKAGTVDYLMLGTYAALSSSLVALIMGTGHGKAVLKAEGVRAWIKQGILPPLLVAYIAVTIAAVLLVIIVQGSGYDNAVVLVAIAAAALFAALSSRIWTLFPLALISAALVGVVLVAWPLAQLAGVVDDQTEALLPLFPAGSSFFLLIATLASVAAFCLGTIKLWASRSGYWASIATLVPVGFFVLAHLKLMSFEHSFWWNWAAAGLFVLFDVVARWIWKNHTGAGRDMAIAAVTIAITSALSLAMTLTFDDAWLTVALSLQVPVLAWTYRRLGVPVLRVLAGLIAVAVLVRLVMNPSVTLYAMKDISPILNWMWYGYGVPALAFAVAARWFAQDGQAVTNAKAAKENWALVLMQATSIVLFVVLVTLQIRAAMAPEVWQWGTYRLMESSLDVIAWLTIALVFYWRYPKQPPIVIHWARRILIIYSSLHILLVNLLLENPMFNHTLVGDWPVINLLTLTYLAPAVLAALFTAISLSRPVKERILPAGFTAASSFLLGFVYIGLEVRRLFHGSNLNAPIDANALQFELYTYSAVWLIIAGLLIWAGLARSKRIVRLAGLGLLAVVVLKVFVVDMSELAGLYRVGSLIGLSICLFIVGQAYQRFVAQQMMPVPPDQRHDSDG